MRAVSDTGPLNYLVLIDHAAILPALFTTVFIPAAVRVELSDPDTPALVRAWIASPPPWLKEEPDPGGMDPALQALDVGEREAILLASSLLADLILMDERSGVGAARDKGFAVTGTVGLIDRAGRRGLIDVAEAVRRLRGTSFRLRSELYDELLGRHRTA